MGCDQGLGRRLAQSRPDLIQDQHDCTLDLLGRGAWLHTCQVTADGSCRLPIEATWFGPARVLCECLEQSQTELSGTASRATDFGAERAADCVFDEALQPCHL